MNNGIKIRQARFLKGIYIIGIYIIVAALLFISGCSSKPTADKLSMTLKSNFNMLPEKPQFVLYFNFKSMKSSEFWKSNISDSLINSERTFGTILNIFKDATGATMSDGLDEMYFANSWTGENAIILKGIFDKNKLFNYTNKFFGKDSSYNKSVNPDGTIVFTHLQSGLLFFLKDNFTICASNYPKQIELMREARDTTTGGLLNNVEMLKAIDAITYKEYFWLVTTEKTFIGGIFENFLNMNPGSEKLLKEIPPENAKVDSLMNPKISSSEQDTQRTFSDKTENILANRIQYMVNSFSLSGRMKTGLEIIIQFECKDDESALYFSNLFNGMIALAKLSSAIKSENWTIDTATATMLNNLKISTYDNSSRININITQYNIESFRKFSIK